MSIFHILRVFSMGHDFFLKTGFYILVFREQYLRRFIFVKTELWVCCSWDNKLSQVCPLFFRSDAGIMLIFHLQSGIREFHFPFTCNLYVKCFGISVTHLTSDLEVPWFESGRLQQFVFFTFFSFWPFTVPSPLNIKTRRIANNVINNPYLLYYYPIITWSITFCV